MIQKRNFFTISYSKLNLFQADILEAGTWKSERIITSKQDVSIKVKGQPGPILNFCANNYLGLSVNNASKARVALAMRALI